MDRRGRYTRWRKKDRLSQLLDLDSLLFGKRIGFEKFASGLWHWLVGGHQRSSIAYQVLPGHGVRLLYNHSGKGFDYMLSWATTTLHFGGHRYWWLCPHCDRRCRILYCRGLFVCRQCSGAHYDTQSTKDPLVRIDNELNHLRAKLGVQSFSRETIPPKPKRMHWRTYTRLAKRIADLQYWRLLANAIDLAKMNESMGIPAPASIEDASKELRRLMGQQVE